MPLPPCFFLLIAILKELFTSEEAEMALSLAAVPERVAEIAAQIAKPTDDVKGCLQEMKKQGLIWWAEKKGVK